MTNAIARTTIRSAMTASLATVGEDGHPFVSLVTVAATEPTTVVMLLSGLAKHTKNLDQDGRCSLLLADPNTENADPLTGTRISLIGNATRLDRGDDTAERETFLDRHPSAAMYADFGDFAFFRVKIEEGHLVAGFGRIETVPANQL